jgi:hypothetical protein
MYRRLELENGTRYEGGVLESRILIRDRNAEIRAIKYKQIKLKVISEHREAERTEPLN